MAYSAKQIKQAAGLYFEEGLTEKSVVDSGLWHLAEYEGPQVSGVAGGKYKLNRNPRSSPA